MTRRVLILGCGAIGGLYAAYLSKVLEVVALDANGEHVAAINRDGLRLSGLSSMVVRLRATSDPRAIAGERFDAVLLLVKSQATRAAFESVKPFIEGAPIVATLQNGMGNVEVLASLCNWDIAQGASMEAGRYAGPGEIHHLVHGEPTWIGPVRGAADIAWLAEALDRAGLPTRFAADPRGAIWAKFIFNCVQNPVGAIVLGVNRARFDSPEVRAVIDAMFAEGIRVAEAQGITLPTDPMAYVKKVRSGEVPMSRHAGSMAADIEAGRETEIDALTGYLVAKAGALGVPVPVSETVYRLMKGVELAARLKREGG